MKLIRERDFYGEKFNYMEIPERIGDKLRSAGQSPALRHFKTTLQAFVSFPRSAVEMSPPHIGPPQPGSAFFFACQAPRHRRTARLCQTIIDAAMRAIVSGYGTPFHYSSNLSAGLIED